MSARQQQFWSGILFIALGLTTFFLSIQFSMWEGRQVGSGLFPASLGLILTGLGVIVFIQGFFVSGGGGGEWKFRPILSLCLAIFVYAVLVERVGNLIALAAAAVIAGFADRPNFKYLAIVYVIVIAFIQFFLIGVIKLPYKLY